MGKLGKLIERERERQTETERETERDRERVTKLQMTKYYKLHCKFLGSILTDSFTEREQCKILFPTFSTVGAIWSVYTWGWGLF